MPKLIDHDERNREIAEASLRVLDRDGLEALSVRRVAEEAGIAPASLRRSFPTQHALREHCLALIQERVARRIIAQTSSGRAWASDVLAQLLPLDADRRLELVAQTQLGVLALTDPALRPAAVQLTGGVAQVCAAAIDALDSAGELGAGRDRVHEARILHAVLDGAALHALWSPGEFPRTQAQALIERHLDGLREDAVPHRE
ncbi:TetR/AcrR family transcriptional regulator [Planctomonas deserti]|uniref:TetR/AcrR family transcriptional regulator n=1 Tax=Planctomonas deserti TaxID=2144185 RepID=UPI000D3832A9|nr:TetR family transcriptional regulator C-terminal domain-containing protein [Planctomonas deserti]